MSKLGVKKKSFLFSLFLVVFFMVIIFLFSSQNVNQSLSVSNRVSEVLVDFINFINPSANLDVQNFSIRKKAHFFIYFILAIVTLNLLSKTKAGKIEAIIITIFICVCFAIFDEIHQGFVPGRGPQLSDVKIDSKGAFLGICVYSVIDFIKRKVLKKNK